MRRICLVMSKKKYERQHCLSIYKKDFTDKAKGPYAALGGPFYVKKILGKTHYLIQASESFYHEITPACFKETIKRSTSLNTKEIKNNLRRFNAQ